jgi:hypothetical protein
MAVIKRIDAVSALKVGFVAFALLGLVLGMVCATIALSGMQFAPHAYLPIAGGLLAVAALVICPILYGVIGSLFTMLAVILYNLASGWTGGLDVDLG